MAHRYMFLAVWLAGAAPAWASAEPPPLRGQVLHVLAFGDSHGRAVQQQLRSFEAATGAVVQMDLVPTQTVSNKVMIDQAGGGSYDLYAVDEPFVPLFAPLMLPLRQWPRTSADTAAAHPDVYPAACWQASSHKGEAYGIPVSGNAYLYVYRQDLFADLGEQAHFMQRYGYALAPPRTTQQMRDVAEFFTRPPQLYGFAPFTQVSEGVTVEVLWLLETFGTHLFGDGLRWSVDEARAEQAFAWYVDMMQFAPPGAAAWHHGERMGAYRRGQIAQIMTWPIFLNDLENPAQSLVVGRNGYGLGPAGPHGRSTAILGSWTLVIPRSSHKARLAAEFAAWWTSHAVGLNLAGHGLNPVRADLLTDPELLHHNPWFPVVQQSLLRATVRPRSVHYREASDVVARVFSKMVSGQLTPHAAVQEMKEGIAQCACN